MTRADAAFATIAFALVVSASGCGRKVDPFPQPGNVTEKASIYRQSNLGPIVVVFTSHPLEEKSPPDGVRAAAMRAVGGKSCSVASFHWQEKAMAERWLGEQIQARRNQGIQPRLILAGHSFGATAAAETVREATGRHPDAVVVLLLTVDAIKTGKIGSTAGVIAGSIPGVKTSFAAYDSAPAPDGGTFLRHINYYQANSALYRGMPMPAAENHLLVDSTALLNHGSADDFAYPLLVADLRRALWEGGAR